MKGTISNKTNIYSKITQNRKCLFCLALDVLCYIRFLQKYKKLTSKYIHWRCTVKIISITSMMSESVRSHLSTSCSNGFTKRDAFIVDSVTWLSDNNCFSNLQPIVHFLLYIQ